MADIEVVEIATARPVVLAYEPTDPLAGAEIVSVTAGQVVGHSLDDLTDVDLAGGQPGQPLLRGPDGVWRPGQFPEPQRGSVISLVDQPPTSLTAQHRAGDYFVALADPQYRIYQVEDQ